MTWSTHRSVQQMRINEPSNVKSFPLPTFDITLPISRTPSDFESKHSAFKSGMWDLIALVRLTWLTIRSPSCGYAQKLESSTSSLLNILCYY